MEVWCDCCSLPWLLAISRDRISHGPMSVKWKQQFLSAWQSRWKRKSLCFSQMDKTTCQGRYTISVLRYWEDRRDHFACVVLHNPPSPPPPSPLNSKHWTFLFHFPVSLLTVTTAYSTNSELLPSSQRVQAGPIVILKQLHWPLFSSRYAVQCSVKGRECDALLYLAERFVFMYCRCKVQPDKDCLSPWFSLFRDYKARSFVRFHAAISVSTVWNLKLKYSIM